VKVLFLVIDGVMNSVSHGENAGSNPAGTATIIKWNLEISSFPYLFSSVFIP
jgi:hypothetical protein